MLHPRKTWLASVVFVLGGLLLTASYVPAGEKKTKPGGPLLNKSEELTDQDEKDSGLFTKESPRKVYKVKLIEGKTYQIDLKSKDFDAVLRVENAEGKEVAVNDDAPGEKTLDSRILYKAPKTEDYKIIATCLDRKPGKFSLTVVEAGGEGATASIFKAKGSELKLADGKGRFEGELNADDPVAKNHYYKLFIVKLEEGKVYRIDHMSTDFDCYLFLEDPDGKTLARDDDGGDGLNSRIVHKAAKSGSYRIIATTLLNDKTGKFTLEVKPASADEAKEIIFLERVIAMETLPLDGQKKLLGEVTQYLQGKGANLSINDVQIAMQATQPFEATDMAPDAYKKLAKAFAGAANPQVAEMAKSFERIGNEFPVTGKTTDGKDYDLKKFKGKVVLVDFWATWCGPCIAELPSMQAAYKKYHGKGFDIVGISLDRPGDDEKLSKFIDGRKMPWPCISIEDSRKLADQYEVNAIPFPVLIDPNGRVVSLRARGPHLDRLLERLLGEKK